MSWKNIADEREEAIKQSVFNKRSSLAGANQFGQEWSDIVRRFNVWKQTGSDEFPVDAFVQIWVPCKVCNASAAGSSSRLAVIHSNRDKSSGS